MANQHMKKCLTILTIREMHIKTIMKYHYGFIRMSKIKNCITPNADKDAEKPDDSYIANRNLKDLVTVEKLGLFSKTLNMQLP